MGGWVNEGMGKGVNEWMRGWGYWILDSGFPPHQGAGQAQTGGNDRRRGRHGGTRPTVFLFIRGYS